jgi:hypothetical protein
MPGRFPLDAGLQHDTRSRVEVRPTKRLTTDNIQFTVYSND